MEQKLCTERKNVMIFKIVKLSFIWYLTTQESTSEAGLFAVINIDLSEKSPKHISLKHAEKHQARLISD